MIKHIVLASRPSGMPVPENFRIDERPEEPVGPGQMRVAVRVFSVDPAIRGFLDDRPSYFPPVKIDAPINGMSLGEVIESNNPDYPVGTHVRAMATWSENYVIGADALGLEKVEPAPGVPLYHYMGTLGPVGLTAWVGLNVIGEAKPGDTVLVSAAAGATGSTVGQIAKIKGCRVIGLVGSDDKVETCRSIGFDAAINYRTAGDLGEAIKGAAPEGIDVYFDNVGGETLETVLPLMRLHGRIAVCGMIGQYNDADHPYGVKTLWQMVVNRLKMRGFITYDHPEVLGEAQRDLDTWVADGRLNPLVNLRNGFERVPEAFIDLMSGRTTGKTMIIV